MEIAQTPIDDVIPYAANSRTHDDAQVAQIAASIKEFGFNNPVLLDGDKGIVAGHGRVLAARKLGLKEIPTIELAHLSETQRKAYIIADNRLALNAGWDMDLLAVEMKGLDDEGFDLSLIGFGDDELANIFIDTTEGLTDPDAVPDVPDDPVTKEGDVWLLGKHRLMCGDSTSIDAVDTLMGGTKADMVFTDPPYGMDLDTDYSKMGDGGKSYKAVIADDEQFDAGFLLSTFSYCKEIFLFGADYFVETLNRQYPDLGSWIIWDKYSDQERHGLLDGKFGSAFETCWSKTKHKRELARVLVTTNYTARGDETRVHPTQKPVALAEWFFERWSNANDTVVDLYGGSGSTLIACERQHRHAYVMELSPAYVDVAVKRWCDFTGEQATLESDGSNFPTIKGINGAKEKSAA